MTVEAVEKKAREIDENYHSRLTPLKKEEKQLETWFKTRPKMVRIPAEEMEKVEKRSAFLADEIGRLETEKKEKILGLYQKENLVASTLNELNRLQAENFKKQPYGSFDFDSVTEAFSEKTKKHAYYCENCKLWINGSSRRGSLTPFGPSYYFFCRICNSKVGEVARQYRLHEQRF